LKLTAGYAETEARDGVPGGIPTTPIAGLFPLFTSELETITPARSLSVQNWTPVKTRARTTRRP